MENRIYILKYNWEILMEWTKEKLEWYKDDCLNNSICIKKEVRKWVIKAKYWLK